MKISDVLSAKPAHSGSSVVTITATRTVRDLVTLLDDKRIGAAVVVDGEIVRGIVSERDVVRNLRTRGAAVLDDPVSDIMTTSVFSCTSEDSLDSVAATMTARRIRHLPVIEHDSLVGLVSIGDVVSSRMYQLEQDRTQLERYITG